MWTLGHEGPPTSALSLSRGTERVGEGSSPRLALLSPYHALPSPGQAMRPSWLPAPRGVPASLVSGITHSVWAWGLLSRWELHEEQRRLFLFLVGEVSSFRYIPRAGEARELLDG